MFLKLPNFTDQFLQNLEDEFDFSHLTILGHIIAF